MRNNLREATRLLREAGYEIRDSKLVNAKTGEPFTVEILIDRPELERIVLPYKPSLERLGIQMTLRIVDDAQYENRLRQWDYDMIVASWGQSLSPGNEQRGYWSSKAADQPGSRNLVGIKNPAVDALVERLIFAKNRAELVAATKALDRVLLWNFYVVPQWTYGKVRSARWDRFGHARSAAEIRLLRLSDGVVVGPGQGGEGGIALVIALSRRRLLGIGAGAVASGAIGFDAQGQPAEPTDAERHGMSSFGDLKYPADFRAFRLRRSRRRPRAARFRRSAPARSTTRISSPSIRSTATSCAATPRRAWS